MKNLKSIFLRTKTKQNQNSSQTPFLTLSDYSYDSNGNNVEHEIEIEGDLYDEDGNSLSVEIEIDFDGEDSEGTYQNQIIISQSSHNRNPRIPQPNHTYDGCYECLRYNSQFTVNPFMQASQYSTLNTRSQGLRITHQDDEDEDSDSGGYNIEITTQTGNRQGGNIQYNIEGLSEESFSIYFDEEEEEKGTKKVNLDKIKEIKLKRKKKQACSVCICDLEKGDKVMKLKCKHYFHRDCILPWLEKNDNCPNCRTALETI